MGCQLAGWIACRGARIGARLADRRGQGTVEYIGMVVMVTILVAAVAVAAKGWAPDVGGALKKGLVSAITKLITGFIT
ncbi:MAG TPA: hypothetical protein VKD47_10165 [Miltoncostaeaceae bacterium]|nr:hypothetical protein [Miltoncostaeaceae bacterium]